MSLSTEIFTRIATAPVKANRGTSMSKVMMGYAKLLHNLRDQTQKANASSYISSKMSVNGFDPEEALHPKWVFNGTNYKGLGTPVASRGTPNAWLDVHCEWALLMLAQGLKHTIRRDADGNRRFLPITNADGTRAKPTGFRLGFMFLTDLFVGTALRTLAFAAKVVIGSAMALVGLGYLAANSWGIVKSLWNKRPLPKGAQQGLALMVPLADAIVKPVLRFAEKYPKTCMLLGVAGIVLAIALTGGMGAPIALAVGKFMFSGFGLGKVVSGIAAGFKTAFATNWLSVALPAAKVLSGFVATGLSAIGTTILGYALRFGLNVRDNKKTKAQDEKKKELLQQQDAIERKAAIVNKRNDNEAKRKEEMEALKEKKNEVVIEMRDLSGAGVGGDQGELRNDNSDNKPQAEIGPPLPENLMEVLTEGTPQQQTRAIEMIETLNDAADSDLSASGTMIRSRTVTDAYFRLVEISGKQGDAFAYRRELDSVALHHGNDDVLIPKGGDRVPPPPPPPSQSQSHSDPQWKGKGKAKESQTSMRPIEQAEYGHGIHELQEEMIHETARRYESFHVTPGSGSSRGDTDSDVRSRLADERRAKMKSDEKPPDNNGLEKPKM